MDIDPDVAWYYGRGRELSRLDTVSQLEAARTRRIIASRLPASGLDIVDVGGGPGGYAVWLAGLGHSVSLLDPMAFHLEQATDAARNTGVSLASIDQGDARRLPYPDEGFDVCLMLGPLYHLLDETDRLGALAEAYRVLKPGGQLYAAALSRTSVVVEGFFRGYVEDPEFEKMMRGTLGEGVHRNPARTEGLFTNSYFHSVADLQSELSTSGFENVQVLAVEGPWSCIPDFDRRWSDQRFRHLLMEYLERLESEPEVVGFGGHLMTLGTRPAPLMPEPGERRRNHP